MWSRPSTIKYPMVWKEFTRKDKNGSTLNFIIQDLTEDFYEACIDHMRKYFFPHEPMHVSLGGLQDKISVEQEIDCWREILPERLSLVCILKNTDGNTSSQIVGLQFQYYHHKEHDDLQEEFKGETFNQIVNIVRYLEAQVDRYKLLNTNDYLDDHGLSVHPDYRCMGIATELLKTRSTLAKTVGVNTIITVFSALASQKAAERAGFKNLLELKYSELAEIFPTYNLNVKETPSIRYMYKTVNDI